MIWYLCINKVCERYRVRNLQPPLVDGCSHLPSNAGDCFLIMRAELWNDIEGYEGKYMISDCGSVKSLERTVRSRWTKNIPVHEKLLKKSIRGGYERVVLVDNGARKTFSVHYLVASAFIPNPGNKPCIDHINGIRNDNRVENLRWCTRKENCNFALARENKSKALRGEKAPWYGKSGSLHVTSKAVSQYEEDGTFVRTYGSIHEAGRETGINYKLINRVCLGQRKKTGGYIWEYANEKKNG